MQPLAINSVPVKELVSKTGNSTTPAPAGFAEALTLSMAGPSTVSQSTGLFGKKTGEKGTPPAPGAPSDAEHSPADCGNLAATLLVALQVPVQLLQTASPIPAQAWAPAADVAVEPQGNEVGFEGAAAAVEVKTEVNAKAGLPEAAQKVKTEVNAKASLPEAAQPAEHASASPSSRLVKTSEPNVPAIPMPVAEPIAVQVDERVSEDPSTQPPSVIAPVDAGANNPMPEIVLSEMAHLVVATERQGEKPQNAVAPQESGSEDLSHSPAGVGVNASPVPRQTVVVRVEEGSRTVEAPDRPQLVSSTARFAHVPPSGQIVPLTPAPAGKAAGIEPLPQGVRAPARADNAKGTDTIPAVQPRTAASITQQPVPAEGVPILSHEPDTLPATAVQVKEAVAAVATSNKKIPGIALPASHAAPVAEVGVAQKTVRTAPAVESGADSREGSQGKPVEPASASLPAPEAPVAPTPAGDFAPAVTAPKDAPAVTGHATSPATTRDLPQAHQVLDSAQTLPAQPATTPVPARGGADSSGDAQMRVGVRTTAFGAVEIYTAVHQNQVGLTVHGGRDLTQWFSSEVQNIESGLRDHHLNLTTVELGSHGTGLQTETGSHHHDAPRSFVSAPKSWHSVTADPIREPDVSLAAPTDMDGLETNYVSIHI
jgi:hypothetical protein